MEAVEVATLTHTHVWALLRRRSPSYPPLPQGASPSAVHPPHIHTHAHTQRSDTGGTHKHNCMHKRYSDTRMYTHSVFIRAHTVALEHTYSDTHEHAVTH